MDLIIDNLCSIIIWAGLFDYRLFSPLFALDYYYFQLRLFHFMGHLRTIITRLRGHKVEKMESNNNRAQIAYYEIHQGLNEKGMIF